VNLSDYARHRLAHRGISVEQVERLVNSTEPFSYKQKVVQRVGYYDEASRIFVAAVGDDIITAFYTRPSYVEGLRRRTS